MELEFDKEIDAILRKAAREPAGSLSSAHLEADAIAAFAENALPATARSFYTNHLADCDRCRSILAHTISLQTEAGVTAASPVIESGFAPAIKLPWYRKLFAVPGLTAAMGILVVLFAGLLAYVAFQRNGNSREVSQLSEKPAIEKPMTEAPAGSSANAASNSAMAANTGTPSTSEGSPLTKQVGSQDIPDEGKSDSDATVSKAPEENEKQPPVTMASPTMQPSVAAPMRKEQPKTELDEKKILTDGVDEPVRQEPQSMSPPRDDRRAGDKLSSKDTSPSAGSAVGGNTGYASPKAKSTGPNRERNNNDRNAAELSRAANKPVEDDEIRANTAGKRVAGKSFERKDGVWYDTAFHGQPTIDIHRGTPQFNLLDSGLKSIANNLSGVVVVVWKGRSYRIQ